MLCYTQSQLRASSERVQLQKVPVPQTVSTWMCVLGLYVTTLSEMSVRDLTLPPFTAVRCDADTANALRLWWRVMAASARTVRTLKSSPSYVIKPFGKLKSATRWHSRPKLVRRTDDTSKAVTARSLGARKSESWWWSRWRGWGEGGSEWSCAICPFSLVLNLEPWNA